MAPAEKDAARLLVRNALRCVDFGKCERMVRINQGERGLEDLDAVVPQSVHVILIPKVETGEHVRAVDARAEKLAHGRGPQAGPASSCPSSRAPWGASRRPTSPPRAPAWWPSPSASRTTRPTSAPSARSRGRESFWARSVVVNAARAAGVTPIDTVFSDVADMEGLRAACLEAKGAGLRGQGLHPPPAGARGPRGLRARPRRRSTRPGASSWPSRRPRRRASAW